MQPKRRTVKVNKKAEEIIKKQKVTWLTRLKNTVDYDIIILVAVIGVILALSILTARDLLVVQLIIKLLIFGGIVILGMAISIYFK